MAVSIEPEDEAAVVVVARTIRIMSGLGQGEFALKNWSPTATGDSGSMAINRKIDHSTLNTRSRDRGVIKTVNDEVNRRVVTVFDASTYSGVIIGATEPHPNSRKEMKVMELPVFADLFPITKNKLNDLLKCQPKDLIMELELNPGWGCLLEQKNYTDSELLTSVQRSRRIICSGAFLT